MSAPRSYSADPRHSDEMIEEWLGRAEASETRQPAVSILRLVVIECRLRGEERDSEKRAGEAHLAFCKLAYVERDAALGRATRAEQKIKTLHRALALATVAIERGDYGSLGTVNGTIQPFVDICVNTLRRAEQQRDELAAALEKLIVRVSNTTWPHCLCRANGPCSATCEMQAARAALAKVRS